MIVQIYTAQTPDEAISLVDCGVDHIGVTPTSVGLPGEISLIQAKDIFTSIGLRAKKIALSVSTDLSEIIEMVRIVNPDVLHMCGDLEKMTPEKIGELRKLLPPIKIMQAIPVIDHSGLAIARAYQSIVDFFILDSYSDSIGGIGAAGFTHDWNISRQIVNTSSIPTILAGGLSPENVKEAIRFVKPWGVDSLTKTNLFLENGKFIKDIVKVQEFVKNAKYPTDS